MPPEVSLDLTAELNLKSYDDRRFTCDRISPQKKSPTNTSSFKKLKRLTIQNFKTKQLKRDKVKDRMNMTKINMSLKSIAAGKLSN